jgi:hypothetical protein
MTVNFIDPLLALPGKERELLARWHELARVLERHPDLRNAKLLSAIELDELPQLGPFTHMLIIEWACQDSLKTVFAREDIAQRLSALRSACLSHSGIFEKADDVQSEPARLPANA